MDDLFDKKKDDTPILDLSKTVIYNVGELREILEKIPEFKTRPERIKGDDFKTAEKIKEKKSTRKELRSYTRLGTRGHEMKHYTFMSPIPNEMQPINFDDLVTVPIDWRMLTTLRPKSKLDEEYFNRLVELGKSQMRTQTRDKRELAKDPMIRRSKNKHSGVTETRIVSCIECGEEYCNGKLCIMPDYDAFGHVQLHTDFKASKQHVTITTGRKIKKLRRRIKKRPSRSKSAATSSITSSKHKEKLSGIKSDSEI